MAQFGWDAQLGRYRTADGRTVKDSAIHSALDLLLNAQATQMRQLTQALIDGQINLGSWQAAMMSGVKSVHIIGATLANGGWAQMDQSDWGWVGQRIRSQYAYLRDFAAQLASGKQKQDGTALSRATLYAEAGRQTHRAAIERLAKQRGMEMEKNVLGAADHCAGCLSATAAGWVSIGTLVPCGSRQCLSRCHCSIIYRMVRIPVAA